MVAVLDAASEGETAIAGLVAIAVADSGGGCGEVSICSFNYTRNNSNIIERCSRPHHRSNYRSVAKLTRCDEHNKDDK